MSRHPAQNDLNLSTKPFPAYRLINIGLFTGLVVLIVISLGQAFGFVQFSSLASSIRPGEREARVEADALGERVAESSSRLDRPEATAKLNEIGFLNQLIARRNLSWTGLFADLEEILPDSVHLVSLSPEIDKDRSVILRITLQGRSIQDVTEFVARLERSPVFEKVVLASEQREDAKQDVDLILKTNYYPQREIQ